MKWFVARPEVPANDPLVRLTRDAYVALDARAAAVDLRRDIRRRVTQCEEKTPLPAWQRLAAQVCTAGVVVLILTVWSMMPDGTDVGPANSAANVTAEFQRALSLYNQAALAWGPERLKLLERSSQRFQEIPERHPADRDFAAAAQLFLADCHMQLEQWDDAVAAYGAVLAQHADDPASCRQARLSLADYYVNRAKDPEGAVPHVEALVADADTAPDAAPVCLALALVFEERSPAQAARWYQTAERLAEPGSPVALKAQENRSTLDARLAEKSLIKDWWLIGPFDNANNTRLAVEEPPEGEVNLGAEYQGKAGPVRWRRPFGPDDHGCINLLEAVGNHELAGMYAMSFVLCPDDRKVVVRLGTDDGCRLWVNDEVVWQNPAVRDALQDQDAVEARLLRGWNRVLLKVVNNYGAWGFCFRITDPAGHLLHDLQFDPLRGGTIAAPHEEND